MRRVVALVLVFASTAAFADDEMPPLEATVRAGYETRSHISRGLQDRITDSGPWIDGEIGVDVMPRLAILGFASYVSLPDHGQDEEHEMGYSYKDSHAQVTDVGLRVRYRADGPYIGGAVGYEMAKFATVYTDLMNNIFNDPLSRSESSIYLEAHVGVRVGRLDDCHCTLDLFASGGYSASWTNSAVFIGRVAAGIAFW